MNTNETTQTTQSNDQFNGILAAQTALNKSGVIVKDSIILDAKDENAINKAFDDLFGENGKLPQTARFAGSTQSISMPADISDEFDVTVEGTFALDYKVSENTTIADKDKEELRSQPIKSINASVKVPVKTHFNNKMYSMNLNVTRENMEEVKALLKNGTAKAITSHWEGLPPRKDGSLIAKLILSPIGTTTPATKKVVEGASIPA